MWVALFGGYYLVEDVRTGLIGINQARSQEEVGDKAGL